MAYQFTRVEKIVAFFIVAIVISIMVIIVAINTQKDWWKRKYVYRTEFLSAKGLKDGQQIFLQSLPIGRVSKLDLNEANRIDLKISIFNQYSDRVREDSVIVLQESIIGQTTLVIYPGSAEASKLEYNAFLQSSDTDRGNLLRRKHEINQQVDDISKILGNVNEITGDISDGSDNIQATARNIDAITYDILRSMQSGNMNYLLHDKGIQINIESMLVELNRLLIDINSVMGDVKGATSIVGDPNSDIWKMVSNMNIVSENLIEITDKLKTSPVLGGEKDTKAKVKKK